MTVNAKTALLSLLGGIGVIVLLIGAFTELYGFTSGLIAAIAIWIVTGVLRSYWGLKGKGSSRKEAPKKD